MALYDCDDWYSSTCQLSMPVALKVKLSNLVASVEDMQGSLYEVKHIIFDHLWVWSPAITKRTRCWHKNQM